MNHALIADNIRTDVICLYLYLEVGPGSLQCRFILFRVKLGSGWVGGWRKGPEQIDRKLTDTYDNNSVN